MSATPGATGGGGGASGGGHGKILTREELLARRAEARRAGRVVVQCHGCFDIVHPGHIRHLRQAKSQGDVLLVTLTGDGHVGKGSGRPLIPQELRAENLAALDCVDWVYIEARPTAAALLEEVQPDVYVKGREYESNTDPRFREEREAVERHGGRVVFSSGDVVFSSTALIEALEASDPLHGRLETLARRAELGRGSLLRLVSGFRGRRVVVIGETIVDTYVFCDRPDVAGESPIMTLRPLERRRYDGGAAVVARHVAGMGARPTLVTALPADESGRAMAARLSAEGVEVRAIPLRTPLAEKQRFLVGAQKILKLDLLEPIVLDAARQVELITTAAGAVREASEAVIITDFALGLFTPRLLSQLCATLRPMAGVMVGDVSGRRGGLLAMRGVDALCPSEQELREALGQFDESLPAVTWRLLRRTGARAAIVTLGADGLVAFERLGNGEGNGETWRRRVRGEPVPALCPVALDPLGCGDALVAAATLAMAGGAPLLTAAFVGSIAAAAHARRLGNPAVSSTDLRQGIERATGARLTCVAGTDDRAPGVRREPGGVGRRVRALRVS